MNDQVISVGTPIRDLNAVGPLTPLRDPSVVRAMSASACLIVKVENNVVGFMTDGDFRRASSSANFTSGLVKDFMNANPVSASYRTTITKAFRTMVLSNINHLFLRDEAEKIIAIVAFHDLAKILSPEQLFIDLEQENFTDNEWRHISRYTFAASFFSDGQEVLDGACGCGYGSSLLAKKGLKVQSVDLNPDAINYAKSRYACVSRFHERDMTFRCDDLSKLLLQENSLDGVVSLETLEHIEYATCTKYLRNIARWIKPGGIFVGSSPMLRYKDGLPYITNPYHINELPRKLLIRMFKESLPGFVFNFFHQKERVFVPLDEEDTGFCIVVARKKELR